MSGDRSAEWVGTDVRSELSSLIRIVVKVFRPLLPVLVPKLGLLHGALRTWPAVCIEPLSTEPSQGGSALQTRPEGWERKDLGLHDFGNCS